MKKSELGLGSAFFGISDPGLVKKSFFKLFFHKKLTGGPGDEIWEIFVLAAFLWGGYLNKVAVMGAEKLAAIPKQNRTHQPLAHRRPKKQKMGIFLKNRDFLERRDKRSEFRLGSAFFGISDLGFLPYGVPIKGVIEKGWIFDEKC